MKNWTYIVIKPNYRIDSNLDKPAIEALVPALATLQTLKKLTLSSDLLDADACSHLSPCLEALPGLEYLNLISAFVGVALDKLFTKKLQLPNLKVLKLSSREFLIINRQWFKWQG